MVFHGCEPPRIPSPSNRVHACQAEQTAAVARMEYCDKLKTREQRNDIKAMGLAISGQTKMTTLAGSQR